MKNKIPRPWSLTLKFLLPALLFATAGAAQNIPINRYGVRVVSSLKEFRETLVGHPERACLPLTGIPGLRLDLRYAGTNNFTHHVVYRDSPDESYLRRAPAIALDSAAGDLAILGYGLLIFDAYRPYSATERLWNLVRDDRYAADPAKGSGHNRAIAVDLTLYDLRTNRILTMPTGFDNFSDTAHQDFSSLPDSVIAHRRLLRKTMEKFGFIALPTEWWHFSWPSPLDYELLDLSFSQLERAAGDSMTDD